MNSLFLLCVLLVFASYILTWIVIRISRKKKILDIPNERSSHKIPTPRGGGVAIVIGWYSGLSIMFLLGMVDKNLYLALLSGVFLAVISLIDDIITLRPSIRLLTQLITVLLSFYFLNGIKSVHLFGVDILPDLILFPVTIIGMVWFINLFNFLDGIDGYASIEAIMVSFALFLCTGDTLNLIIISSIIGFLIWNWPKAKVFMGDVGSTQLGFILVVLGIHYHNNDSMPLLLWITITAPFWFDATLTLFRRWRKKEILSHAHCKHVYQRLVHSGFSHLKVDIYLIITNLILITTAYICLKYYEFHLLLLLIVLTILYLIIRYTDKRKPFS